MGQRPLEIGPDPWLVTQAYIAVAKALVRVPAPIVWEEETSKVDVKPDASDEASGGLTAH